MRRRPFAAGPAAWRCGGDAPRLVAGERPGRGTSGTAPLEIDVGERLPVVVADDGAGVSRLTFG
jgi:hypothetical protein